MITTVLEELWTEWKAFTAVHAPGLKWPDLEERVRSALAVNPHTHESLTQCIAADIADALGCDCEEKPQCKTATKALPLLKAFQETLYEIWAGKQNPTSLQKRVTDWAIRCFGEGHVMDPQVRGMRLVEESIEFAQAVCVPIEKCHSIIDYVYSRPAGEPSQELGGVGVTWMAAATAIKANALETLLTEITRVEAKSPEHFAARNQNKCDLGFTTEAK